MSQHYCYRSVALALLFVVCAPAVVRAQAASVTLETAVVDEATGRALPMVIVRNPARNTATATDATGAFALPGNLPGDTLVVAHPGYETERIALLDASAPHIALRPPASELRNVVVLGDGDTEDYLYELVHSLRRERGTPTHEAKTYAFAETTIDSSVAELGEAYYNGTYVDGAAVDLDHKKSRIGIRPVNGRVIAGTHIGERIQMYDVYTSASDFPESPLCLSKGKARKAFALELADRYLDGGVDVFVVDFTPRANADAYFSGRMWIDRERARLLRITLDAQGASRHPFDVRAEIPGGIDLAFEKVFTPYAGGMLPMSTRAECRGQFALDDGRRLDIGLSVLTVAYDYDQTFSLPSLPGANVPPQSYRDASASPYDSAFWARTDQFRLFDRAAELDRFTQLRRPPTEREVEFLASGNVVEPPLATPYLLWSPERIDFRSGGGADVRYQSELCESAGSWLAPGTHLYLDVSELPRGELSYQTASVLDPLGAAFPEHVDVIYRAYLNMQFDLLEVQRRWLEEELADQEELTREGIEGIYEKHLAAYEKRRETFEQQTKRGRKLLALEQWSQHIFEQIGVDNFRRYALDQM